MIMRTLCLAIGAASLAGCMTTVTSKRAEPAAAGIHYFLPQPFIKVTPSKDGKIAVEVIYLPDPDNEYAISASSSLGNYTLDIKRTEEGFLDTVSFDSDNTGIAKQLIDSGSAVRAAQIEARATKAKAAEEAAKADADKAAAALETAKKDQAAAQLAFDIATRKLEVLRSLVGTPEAPSDLRDQIVAAQLAAEEATFRLNAAGAQLVTLRDNLKAANAQDPQAPEPAFLKVVMTADSVSLQQDFDQSDRPTWQAPSAEPPPEFDVLPASLVVRPQNRTKALIGTVTATVPLRSVVFTAIAPKPPAKNPILSLRADRVTVDVNFDKNTPDGDYTVTCEFDIGSSDQPDPQTIELLVRIER